MPVQRLRRSEVLVVAWRSDDVVPVLLYDSSALKQQLLNEQASLVRRGCCMTCGVPVDRCICGDYDKFDTRPLEGSDDLETGVA